MNVKKFPQNVFVKWVIEMSKYLMITLYDNDFTSYATLMGEALYNIFYTEDHYITEEDIPVIKEYIDHFWGSFHNLVSVCRFGHNSPTRLDYFDTDILIVDDEYVENEKNSYPNFTKLFIKLEDCDDIPCMPKGYIFVL